MSGCWLDCKDWLDLTENVCIFQINIEYVLQYVDTTESKPQRFGATSCKSSTLDKLQISRTIFGISC